jgi:ABC-type transporter Mla subunit MlaD
MNNNLSMLRRGFFAGRRSRTKLLTWSVCIFLLTAGTWAQSRKDPLTEKQIEEVREAGDEPLVRVKLFVGYVEDRANAIQAIEKDAHAQNRDARLHTLMDEFTRLADDLQDNVDAFNQDHADLRKILKELVDKSAVWTGILNDAKPSPQYDFVRKTALDANGSVHDAAKQLLAEQETYFAEKKKADKEAQKKADKESETR